MEQHLLFDLDDTLIHCNRFFNEAREEFFAAMADFFRNYPLDLKMVDDIQHNIDLSGIVEHGLGKDRFPESLVATYRLMCDKHGKQPSEREERELLSIGYGVYVKPIELYPHAHETLMHLKKEGHELYLYTGGDHEIQTSKVMRAGLEDIFPANRRFISEHKNRSFLQKIITSNELQREHTWMIGNSARNDIRPALEEGIHAIHLPDKGGWAFDHADLNVPVTGMFHTLDNILHVPPVIRSFVDERKENKGSGLARS